MNSISAFKTFILNALLVERKCVQPARIQKGQEGSGESQPLYNFKSCYKDGMCNYSNPFFSFKTVLLESSRLVAK